MAVGSSTHTAKYTGDDDTLHIADIISEMHNFKYRVVVSGTCTPSVTSGQALLTVYEKPEVTGDPLDSTICENSNASFTVDPGVTTSPGYQWQVSTDNGSTYNNVAGFIYSGNNSATLHISGAGSGMD